MDCFSYTTAHKNNLKFLHSNIPNPSFLQKHVLKFNINFKQKFHLLLIFLYFLFEFSQKVLDRFRQLKNIWSELHNPEVYFQSFSSYSPVLLTVNTKQMYNTSIFLIKELLRRKGCELSINH